MIELSPPDSELLENYRFQFGAEAGNLAFVLDQLTDALRLVNQHTVYCRVERARREAEPPPDIQELARLLAVTKELVRDSLTQLRK